MYYDKFAELCAKNGIKPAAVSRGTGISTATLTEWKKGTYSPKADKIKLIADFFGVSVDYFYGGESSAPYYLTPETAEIAQAVFDDPQLRMLFDAARDVKPENIALAAEMLKRMKETNPDG